MKKWVVILSVSIILTGVLAGCREESPVTVPTRIPSATPEESLGQAGEEAVAVFPTQTATDSAPTLAPSATVTAAPTETPTLAAPTATSQPPSATPVTENPPQAGAVGEVALPEVVSEPVPDTLVIQFAPETSAAERAAFLQSINGSVQGELEGLDTVVISVPAGTDTQAVLSAPIVAASEPDYFAVALQSAPESVPNDPYFAEQWALGVMGVSTAWAEVSPEAAQTVVAVVDSGICLNHPDLSGRILEGYDYIEDDETPQDAFGHGCAVASLIAAERDNSIGIAGIAPNARILPLRVLDASGLGRYSDVAAAIVYATDQGAQIINLSVGGANPSFLLESAVNYASQRGVVIVAAAGNTGAEGLLYPARYPGVVSVGSVDRTLNRSLFSNHSADIDAYAPGQDIIAASLSGEVAWFNGTSFAAAQVSGLVALQVGRGQSLITNGGIASLGEVVAQPPTPIPTDEPGELPEENVIMPLALIGPEDDRYRNSSTTFAPSNTMTGIQFYPDGENESRCSGVLIHPQYVLTAAHCIYSDGQYNGDIADVWVVPGGNDNFALAGRTISDWYVPDEWINDGDPNGGSDFDFGVIRLTTPTTVPAANIMRVEPLTDGALRSLLLTTSGYPGDKCTYIDNSIGTCPPSQYWSYVLRWAQTQWYTNNGRVATIQPNTFTHNLDTFGGQSGSPIYAHISFNPEVRVIVGVVSASPISPECPAYQQRQYGYICTENHRNIATRITDDVIRYLVQWGVPGYSLPTEITVAAGDTAGLISAINTLNMAGGGDILLEAGDYVFSVVNNNTLNGPSALPVITTPIRIQALGEVHFRRDDAAPPMRLMAVSSTGELTLTGVRFSNGYLTTGNGGALYNAGRVDLSGITFENNRAETGEGGAFYQSGQWALIGQVTFRNNQAARGGALRNNAGTMRASDALFEDNASTSIATAGGGAVSGNLAIYSGTFLNNTSASNGGAMEGSGGVYGGLFSGNTAPQNGGAIYFVDGFLSVENVEFYNNTATRGGAIYALETLGVDFSHFEDNLATSSTGNAQGGAIYFSEIGEIYDSTFIANRAISDIAFGRGGAIYAEDETPSIQVQPLIGRLNFFDNVAQGATGGTGGAIYYIGRIAAATTSSRNCFVGNSDVAVATVTTGGAKTLTIPSSWWGSGDGPSGAGSGTGDSISNGIVASSPGTGSVTCPPRNNTIALATSVTPSRQYVQDIRNATVADSDPLPSCADQPYPNLWYRVNVNFTTPTPFTVAVEATVRDVVVSVWQGDPITLSEVACVSSPGNDLLVPLDFVAQAGQTYYIMVASRSPGTEIRLRTSFIDSISPVLLSPANNATLPLSTRMTAFNWQTSSTLSYELQIWHEDSLPVTYQPTSVTSIPYQPWSIPQAGRYFWRVRARSQSGAYTGWSETLSFTYTSPSNAAPGINRYTTRLVTLSWSEISWAIGYEVELFDHPSLEGQYRYDSEVVDTNSHTFTLDGRMFYWRVRAIGPDGAYGAWSSTQSFVVDVP